MFISPVGVVKHSLEVYQKNMGALMRYVGLLFAAALLAVLILGIGLFTIVGLSATDSTGLLGLISSISGSFITFLSIWAFIFFFFMLWLQIAFIRTVSRAVQGQEKISIVAEFKQSWSLILRTFGTSMLVGLIEIVPFAVGFLAWMFLRSPFGGASRSGVLIGLMTVLSIYGFFHMVYFSIRLGFSVLGVVVDGRGIKESLQKSSELVKGRWWGVFGRLLLAVLALIIPYYIFAGLSTM